MKIGYKNVFGRSVIYVKCIMGIKCIMGVKCKKGVKKIANNSLTVNMPKKVF
jgi:hypothetical protein